MKMGVGEETKSSVLEHLTMSRCDPLAECLGLWRCMDTMRDQQVLEQLWASEALPWRRW